jgi:hypothetical protein
MSPINFKELVTSPPPATGWDLDLGDAVVVHRSGSDGLHCASEALPPGAFEVGAVGLQAVDVELAGPVLARLKGAAEGASTGALIVPTSWLRTFLIDADRPPRKEKELHEIVRWRLKKLLPVAPAELRLSVVRLPEIDGRRSLLVLAGIERAMATLEAAFRGVGVELGLITSRLFAVVPHDLKSGPPVLLIQLEPGYLSIVLLVGGVPRLLRTKLLAGAAGTAAMVVRELRLTLEFVRDRIGLAEDLSVKLVCADRHLGGELSGWLEMQPSLVSLVEGEPAACGPTAVVERIGGARLAPAVAVVTGAVR